MASTPALLSRSAQLGLLLGLRRPLRAPICPFCSLNPHTGPRARRRDAVPRRWQSSTPPRAGLQHALVELQSRYPNLVRHSRLPLALQGLRQVPGDEVVRIAVLGLANGAGAAPLAKRLLRALLVDPLKDEEAWERELETHDPDQPLIVRIAPRERRDGDLQVSTDAALRELHVSSADLNGFNLELLLMQVMAPSGVPGDLSRKSLKDAVLTPSVNMPSAKDRVFPIATPVHQALLVADGLMGAASVAPLPVTETNGAIRAAVQIEGVSQQQLKATFDVVDVSLAEEGIRLLRQGPQHAMEYERLWFASNLPALTAWLKAGVETTERATKPAVRQLVASVLQNTLSSIQAEETRNLSETLAAKAASPATGALQRPLAEWAQKAHAELQDELDLAFSGPRWRKLGWWKLFWRVDDVAMLTNEMLSQRFLPTAEQELVYLTGRIAHLGGPPPQYSQPPSSRADAEASLSEEGRFGTVEDAAARTAADLPALPKWPGHIAFTRRYLQDETVPALQSLAQRLVFQSLSTSGVMASLAALLYVSAFVSTLYEAGAVAALGIVYSLGRMQKKWEAARSFWEGEVREEGRKAVRGAEESVATVLGNQGPNKALEHDIEELHKARDLVARAEDALTQMK